MDEQSLTALFRRLGAPHPEAWARSQLAEGIPQLARYLFLRQAWKNVVPEGDSTWISIAIDRAAANPDEPYAGVGHALRKLKELGAGDAEITDLVRGMQGELLYSICYLLDDPGELEDDISHINWTLAEVDEEGNLLAGIGGLHESVLETDPTGREMRPRPTSR
jgi:hypothetical protein